MKTKEEIKQWLIVKPWYAKYLNNILNRTQDVKEVDSFPKGEHGENTIKDAFKWDKSESKQFWDNINEEFIKWYNE